MTTPNPPTTGFDITVSDHPKRLREAANRMEALESSAAYAIQLLKNRDELIDQLEAGLIEIASSGWTFDENTAHLFQVIARRALKNRRP